MPIKCQAIKIDFMGTEQIEDPIKHTASGNRAHAESLFATVHMSKCVYVMGWTQIHTVNLLSHTHIER